MKKVLNSGLLVLMLISVFTFGYSQGDGVSEEENYVKRNIALTKFKVLGVNVKQYAKCLESVNYLDADKKLKFTMIERTDFGDDGRNYDLVANDGILTSTTLFTYDADTEVVQAGAYKIGASHDSFVIDDSFAHQAEIGSGGKFKIIIGCKFKWVTCSQMTNPGNQYLCNWAGWPYGSFQVTECEFKVEF